MIDEWFMQTPTYRFYKKHRSDKVWWVDELDEGGEPLIGTLMVSFDGENVVNLWTDYPNLTDEQKKLFDKENPYWRDYLSPKTKSTNSK